MSETSTVFIIDDDSSVRRSLGRLLASVGYEVIACASAEEFLALPHETGPACLVTDIRMPGMTGLDLLDAIRRAARPLPIILSSGDIDSMTSAAAEASGVVRFLTKPFTVQDLLAAIEDALRVSRAAIPVPR